MIAGADLLDFAGAVQKQINSVDLLQVRPDRVRKTAFDVIKRVFCDHAVAAGVGVDRTDRFNSGRGVDVRNVHLAQTVLAEGHIVMVDPGFSRDVGVGFCDEGSHQNFHSDFSPYLSWVNWIFSMMLVSFPSMDGDQKRTGADHRAIVSKDRLRG